MKNLHYDFGDYEITFQELKHYYLICFSHFEITEELENDIENYIYGFKVEDKHLKYFEEFDDEELIKEFFREDALEDYKDSQMTDNERYGISQKMFI